MPARDIIEAQDDEHYGDPEPESKCPHCVGGKVAVEGGRYHWCPDCRGKGIIPDEDEDEDEE